MAVSRKDSWRPFYTQLPAPIKSNIIIIRTKP
jgi:hypothetical protein